MTIRFMDPSELTPSIAGTIRDHAKIHGGRVSQRVADLVAADVARFLDGLGEEVRIRIDDEYEDRFYE